MDINMDNSIKLKDNDIVDLEINTKIGSKYFKASVSYINFFVNAIIVLMGAYYFGFNIFI